jgi:hypothetical protein
MEMEYKSVTYCLDDPMYHLRPIRKNFFINLQNKLENQEVSSVNDMFQILIESFWTSNVS